MVARNFAKCCPFTTRLSSEFVTKVTVMIPALLESVAALPCKIRGIFVLAVSNGAVFFAPPFIEKTLLHINTAYIEKVDDKLIQINKKNYKM